MNFDEMRFAEMKIDKNRHKDSGIQIVRTQNCPYIIKNGFIKNAGNITIF